MMKKFLKISGLLVLLLGLVLAFLVYGKVDPNEQIKNRESQNITQILDFSKLQMETNETGLSTEVELNSQQLASLTKASLAEDSPAQDMALGLEGEEIRMEMPVKLGFFPSKLVLYGQPRFEGENFVLQVTRTKLGSLPLPKGIYLYFIKQGLQQSASQIRLEGDNIQVPLSFPVGKVTEVKVGSGKLLLKLNLDFSQFFG